MSMRVSAAKRVIVLIGLVVMPACGAPAVTTLMPPRELLPMSPPWVRIRIPLAGVTDRPLLPPAYPQRAWCDGTDGTVELTLKVDAKGRPVTVELAQSSRDRDLDRAAIDAARQWTFLPLRKDGVAVGDEFQARVAFLHHPRPAACAGVAGKGAGSSNLAGADALAALERAAAAGDAGAQLSLGRHFLDGNSSDRDPVRALQWLRQAAAHGDAEAEFALGKAIADGIGTPRDSMASREWYEKAAAQGLAAAQAELGAIHVYGDGVPADAVTARGWFEKAAAQGEQRSQRSLAYMYHFGPGELHDDVLALAWLLVRTDRSKDDKTLRLQIEQGLLSEQLETARRLAARWAPGELIRHTPDPADAIPLPERLAERERAAQAGDVQAALDLGDLYGRRVHATDHDSEARKWYEVAAGEGSLRAMRLLAVDYSHGTDGGLNRARARLWFEKAAQVGSIQDALDAARFFAQAVPPQPAEAARWYAVAAAHGDIRAQLALAIQLASGSGVPRDDVLAYAWCRIITRSGDDGMVRPGLAGAASAAPGIINRSGDYGMARAGLAQLQARMRPADVLEGTRLADAWRRGQTLTRGARK